MWLSFEGFKNGHFHLRKKPPNSSCSPWVQRCGELGMKGTRSIGGMWSDNKNEEFWKSQADSLELTWLSAAYLRNDKRGEQVETNPSSCHSPGEVGRSLDPAGPCTSWGKRLLVHRALVKSPYFLNAFLMKKKKKSDAGELSHSFCFLAWLSNVSELSESSL